MLISQKFGGGEGRGGADKINILGSSFFQALLPNFPENDLAEKMKTLKMLFGGLNIAFGNPLYTFRYISRKHCIWKPFVHILVNK